MMPITAAARWFRTRVTGHRVELAHSLRVTASAVLGLAASHVLHLPIPLWAVLTAVILTQLSVGKSLGATADYFIGTVGAAVYAGTVGALSPRHPDREDADAFRRLAAPVRLPKLIFFRAHTHLADEKAFAAFLAPPKGIRWFVYSKRPFAGPQAVLA